MTNSTYDDFVLIEKYTKIIKDKLVETNTFTSDGIAIGDNKIAIKEVLWDLINHKFNSTLEVIKDKNYTNGWEEDISSFRKFLFGFVNIGVLLGGICFIMFSNINPIYSFIPYLILSCVACYFSFYLLKGTKIPNTYNVYDCVKNILDIKLERIANNFNKEFNGKSLGNPIDDLIGNMLDQAIIDAKTTISEQINWYERLKDNNI